MPIKGNMPINIIRRNRASEGSGSAALKQQCPKKDTALVKDGETPYAERSRPNIALAKAKHPFEHALVPQLVCRNWVAPRLIRRPNAMNVTGLANLELKVLRQKIDQDRRLRKDVENLLSERRTGQK